jgi:hypothetical protein
MLSRAKQIMAQVNLNFGTVQYFDGTADQATALSTIDSIDGPDSKLSQLMKVGADNGRSLNLYFVDQILDTTDPANPTHILGISPGVPGPAMIGGTSRSGVAVETTNLGADPNTSAQTMTHEMFHFLGLFHTTERYTDDRYNTDPIDDTPECPKSQDGSVSGNPNGQLGASECTSFDAGNLMFWAGVVDDGKVFPVGTLPIVSAQQAQVLKGNPLLK